MNWRLLYRGTDDKLTDAPINFLPSTSIHKASF
jgi:hypothetical protein